ncbi:M48 family metalloprotease [Streptomyces sp. NBC_01275]|uniref:M48 family metalloprotease n=1 Tax=Streptomyces sp. NBC_01275 TaxID=2903807 RepID=UPI002253F427|nr:M48 family metalloprotease [Streptomyces sp. NBC_01275]MCX4764397.1 M48 family metalloprotease [Streptomyces sp. NBC_01275]
MDIPIGDGMGDRSRVAPGSALSPLHEWLLGVVMLALAWLPRAVAGAVAVLLFSLWGPPWAPLAPLFLVVVEITRAVGAGRGPLPGRAVRPGDEPELTALVRDVAERLGFRGPLLVRIVPGVQAALGRADVSGVRAYVLLLGLPLLRTLTEAELACVIAHELAHERHARDRRATLLRFARARLADRLDGRFRPLAPLAAPLLRASQPVFWHAETAADADAARIGGSAATAEALRRVALLDAAFDGLGERWLSALAEEDAYPEDFYDAVDTALADPHVVRRTARAAAQAEAVDPYATADHPPLEDRVAALPPHSVAPYGTAPLTLRTAAAVEAWCVRRLAGLDWEPANEPGEDVRPVRVLDLPHSELRELGYDTRLSLLHATRRDSSTEAVALALDALADGGWTRLARRVEPALRRVPASVRPAFTRSVLASAVSPPFAEVLCATGWTYTSPWLTTVVTAPDEDRVVDLHELLGEALRSGDPGPVRALWASAEPKEWAV